MTDTDPEALRVMIGQYAKMSPAAKLSRVRALTAASSRLALAGFRTRHPGEAFRELLLRLARIRLGDELIAVVYRDATPSDGA